MSRNRRDLFLPDPNAGLKRLMSATVLRRGRGTCGCAHEEREPEGYGRGRSGRNDSEHRSELCDGGLRVRRRPTYRQARPLVKPTAGQYR